MFYHSLVSDWNHGKCPFLRGVAGDLQMQPRCVVGVGYDDADRFHNAAAAVRSPSRRAEGDRPAHSREGGDGWLVASIVGTIRRADAAFEAIRAELLDQFVVDAKQQERRYPLAEKQAQVFVAGHLQHRGCTHCANRQPQEGIRRQLRRLLLNRSSHSALGVLCGLTMCEV